MRSFLRTNKHTSFLVSLKHCFFFVWMLFIVVGILFAIDFKHSQALTGLWTPQSIAVANLNAAALMNSTQGFVVGNAGVILRTLDGGASWSSQFFAPEDLNGVSCLSASSPLNCVAVGTNGKALRTTDDGTTWADAGPGGAITHEGVSARLVADKLKTWTVGSYFFGGLLRESWFEKFIVFLGVSRAHAQAANRGFVNVAPDMSAPVWAAQLDIETPLHSIFFFDALNGWVVGDGGVIYRTINGGAAWTQFLPPPVATALRSVYFIDAQHGWIVGDGGVILTTSDGGANNWSSQNSGVLGALTGIKFVDQNVGFAVGAGGVILATQNAGQTWALQPSGTPASLSGVAAVSVGGTYKIFTVGSGGVFVSSTQYPTSSSGGALRDNQRPPSPPTACAFVADASNIGFSVERRGSSLADVDSDLKFKIYNSADLSLIGESERVNAIDGYPPYGLQRAFIAYSEKKKPEGAFFVVSSNDKGESVSIPCLSPSQSIPEVVDDESPFDKGFLSLPNLYFISANVLPSHESFVDKQSKALVLTRVNPSVDWLSAVYGSLLNVSLTPQGNNQQMLFVKFKDLYENYTRPQCFSWENIQKSFGDTIRIKGRWEDITFEDPETKKLITRRVYLNGDPAYISFYHRLLPQDVRKFITSRSIAGLTSDDMAYLISFVDHRIDDVKEERVFDARDPKKLIGCRYTPRLLYSIGITSLPSASKEELLDIDALALAISSTLHNFSIASLQRALTDIGAVIKDPSFIFPFMQPFIDFSKPFSLIKPTTSFALLFSTLAYGATVDSQIDEFTASVRKKIEAGTFDKKQSYQEIKQFIRDRLFDAIDGHWAAITENLFVPTQRLSLQEAVDRINKISPGNDSRGHPIDVAVPIQTLRILQGLKDSLAHFVENDRGYFVPALDYALSAQNHPEVVTGTLWKSYIPEIMKAMEKMGTYELFRRIDSLLRELKAGSEYDPPGLFDIISELQDVLLHAKKDGDARVASLKDDIRLIIAGKDLAPDHEPLPPFDPEDNEIPSLKTEFDLQKTLMKTIVSVPQSFQDALLNYLQRIQGAKREMLNVLRRDIYLQLRRGLATILKNIYFNDSDGKLEELLERFDHFSESLELSLRSDIAAKIRLDKKEAIQEIPELLRPYLGSKLENVTDIGLNFNKLRNKLIVTTFGLLLRQVRDGYGKYTLTEIVAATESILSNILINDMASNQPELFFLKNIPKNVGAEIVDLLTHSSDIQSKILRARRIAKRLDLFLMRISHTLRIVKDSYLEIMPRIESKRHSVDNVTKSILEQLVIVNRTTATK